MNTKNSQVKKKDLEFKIVGPDDSHILVRTSPNEQGQPRFWVEDHTGYSIQMHPETLQALALSVTGGALKKLLEAEEEKKKDENKNRCMQAMLPELCCSRTQNR